MGKEALAPPPREEHLPSKDWKIYISYIYVVLPKMSHSIFVLVNPGKTEAVIFGTRQRLAGVASLGGLNVCLLYTSDAADE